MVVWAYKPIEELQGKTGFVNVADKELAKKLLDSGEVQNPLMGAAALSPIQKGPIQKKVVRRRKKKVVEPETVETDERSDED
jgi:ABC-type branched-subunit amino acid transport system substrate-binding protein